MLYFLANSEQDLAMYHLVFDVVYENFSRTKGLLIKPCGFVNSNLRKFS